MKGTVKIMEWLSLNDIREKYLKFYESKGHLRHKSFPLVPQDDKSLLLINAGMAPLKKYFTGEKEPPRHRMTTCQKCIRTPDIERVGITARHGTYFEMLGNFSFGDYFKHEATAWAWEFCTKELELPVDRLYVSIYENDDEAFDIWTKEVGVDPTHIVRLGKEDNFWEIGSGPCGPCSELYFDRGIEHGCGSPDCAVGCDCDRFVEFWNLVFTQFEGDGNGNYTPLAKPNIDTGMGLERIACIMQNVNNLFEVDTVQNIMKAIIAKAGIVYGSDPQSDISLRVITDHIRSTCFLICDGVVPSNEGRGYVLRRLLRRAARHGKLLGIKGTFLSDIVPVVAKENLSEYPELTEKLDYIRKIVSIEEEKFAKTIDSGMDMLNDMIKRAVEGGESTLSAQDVFKLNDTYGFPLDLTREIATEKGISIDEKGFAALMNEQKERARRARAELGDFSWSDDTLDFASSTKKTEFTGYDELESKAEVVAIISADNEAIGAVTDSDAVVILDRTPFYGEGGGQVGDSGVMNAENAEITVNDTKKTNGIYLHRCHINGTLAVGDKVTAKVDGERRDAIRRNHSAAHLLQGALRKVLGTHVEQAGSYVDAERVRFDFSHYTAMTQDELCKVEQLVNEAILSGTAVQTVETDVETARSMGAMALFGEKYGAVVRVVKMGEYSTELCGGTHLDNTAKAGLFKIITESSVASGVRRIEGTTGKNVLKLLEEKQTLIANCARELKASNPNEIDKKAASLQAELKEDKHEIERLNNKIAASQADEIFKNSKTVGAFTVITGKTEGVSVDGVRALCDKIKSQTPNVVAVIATNNDGKLNLVACAGAEAVKSGAHAGNILKEISKIAGGGGGGRPDNATSGVKLADKIDDALNEVYNILERSGN